MTQTAQAHITELCATGDEARLVSDWRDALRWYQEALWACSRHEVTRHDPRLTLYQRIGDLQMQAAGEPEIARGYYETALAYARTTDDRVRLLCRLAETYRRSPQALQLAEEAARLAANSKDRVLRLFTEFRRAETTPHVSRAERGRIFALGQAVLAEHAMPADWRELARGRVLAHAGEMLDEDTILAHAEALPGDDRVDLPTARYHLAVADGLRRVGRLAQAVRCGERACAIYHALGRHTEEAGARGFMAVIGLALADLDGVRRHCRWVLEHASSVFQLEALSLLCETWIHDGAAEAVDWARQHASLLVQTAEAKRPPDTRALHELGSAERILRAAGIWPDRPPLGDGSDDGLCWQGWPAAAPTPMAPLSNCPRSSSRTGTRSTSASTASVPPTSTPSSTPPRHASATSPLPARSPTAPQRRAHPSAWPHVPSRPSSAPTACWPAATPWYASSSTPAASARPEGPFIALNCAAVPRDLLERELFGHVRGAYTGADESRGGLFEAASGGTLMLDEIGEASLDLQLRLLRVIEEQVVRPVGSTRDRPVRVRIVSATNESLERAIEAGRFRRDLYNRLRGSTIHLPPLRERPDDIPLLACHALDQWSRHHPEPHPGIGVDAMQTLQAYPWPGNVRELLHEVQEAASCAPHAPLRSRDLGIRAAAPGGDTGRADATHRLRLVTEAMRSADGNVSLAARELGISRSTIYRWLREMGMR